MRLWPAVLICGVASAQTSEFFVDLKQPRALHEAVRQLSLRTGWPISYEDPVWPADERLPSERLIAAVLLPARADLRTQTQTVGEIVRAFNTQNTSTKFLAESAGSVTLVKAAAPASLMLDQMIEIPKALRYPHEHGDAIAKAVIGASGVQMTFVIGNGMAPASESIFGAFDVPFLGRTPDPRKALGDRADGPHALGLGAHDRQSSSAISHVALPHDDALGYHVLRRDSGALPIAGTADFG